MRSRSYWFFRDLFMLVNAFGVNVITLVNAFRGIPAFIINLAVYCARAGRAPGAFRIRKIIPSPADRFSESGVANGHYFHQDLLVARSLFRNRPKRHIDIGSRVDGFAAHVASFRPIEIIDVRALSITVENMRFRQLNICDELPDAYIACCDSVSCLHALEHFGLGRYGDRVDPAAYITGFQNITAMLKPGGRFYFSVPLGPQRVEFDALRVFSLTYLCDLVSRDFTVDSFAFVDDTGGLNRCKTITPSMKSSNCGCYYGCAIFELIKKNTRR